MEEGAHVTVWEGGKKEHGGANPSKLILPLWTPMVNVGQPGGDLAAQTGVFVSCLRLIIEVWGAISLVFRRDV
jgi:hypothetical protein